MKKMMVQLAKFQKVYCCILLLILWFFWLPQQSAEAQELNCQVSLDTKLVQSQEQQLFEQMKEAIERFLNTTKFTNLEFAADERIDCGLTITLGAQSTTTTFEATVQVSYTRPVFRTNYNTPILQYFDRNWRFTYAPSERLFFTPNTNNTPLVQLLAFYAFTIIGMDMDTFADKSGDQFLTQALNIMNNASQNGALPGWNSFGDTRDRYWLIENLNNPVFVDFREALYLYHRKGMDLLVDEPEKARKAILTALQKIKRTNDANPGSMLINIFFDAKSDELVNIFSRGDAAMREQAANLLMELDPLNAADYKKLI